MTVPTPPRSAGETGRVVMIVGASSGIGLATAQRLAARGDRVALVARDRAALDRAAADLPGHPLVLPADLNDPESLLAAVESCLATHGRLDAVITSAQVMAYGTIEQVPADIFDTIVSTATTGTVHLVQAVLPVFRRQGHGTLVVVNSLLGQIAVPSMGAYITAKWGQLGLVRSLQLELRPERDIHVCMVSPGAIDTPIYNQAATYAGTRGSAPPPVISPDAVAKAAVRLLDHPRRLVQVGPVNVPAILGYRFAPFVYDRLVGPMVSLIVLRGPTTSADDGNVRAPVGRDDALHGGWTFLGRIRPDGGGRPRWRRK